MIIAMRCDQCYAWCDFHIEHEDASMTPEREKLIRDAWERVKGNWPAGHSQMTTWLKEPALTRLRPYMDRTGQGAVPSMDKITFVREIGNSEAARHRRITCEGITLVEHQRGLA